jgi:hypothetical protein
VPRIPLLAKFTAEEQCIAKGETGLRCVGYSIDMIFRTQHRGKIDDVQQKRPRGCIQSFRCNTWDSMRPMLMIFDSWVVSAVYGGQAAKASGRGCRRGMNNQFDQCLSARHA